MVTLVEDDRIGLIADILSILERSGVAVNSVNVEIFLGKAVVSLDLSGPDKGRALLASAGYGVISGEAALVVLKSHTVDARSLTAMLSEKGVTVLKIRTLAANGKKNLISVLSDNPKKIAMILKDSVVAAASLD
jgi:hypothetical protein